MPTLGTPELILILTAVILLVGAGRISRLGKEFGQSIYEFRHSLRGEGEK